VSCVYNYLSLADVMHRITVFVSLIGKVISKNIAFNDDEDNVAVIL